MNNPLPRLSLSFEISDGDRVRHVRKSVTLKSRATFSEFNAMGSFPKVGNEMTARRHMAAILRGLADEMENEKVAFLPKDFWRLRSKAEREAKAKARASVAA